MTDIEGNKQKTIVPVQIPVGAVPGGSFEFIAANGKTILVSVPPDAVPGGFIDVCIDDDDDDEDIELRLKKSTIGAAVAGGLVGSLLLGPFIGIALAIGAGYTAAQGVEKFPKVQSSMKTIGKHSFVGMIKAKDWSLARLEELKEKVQKFNEERAAAAAAAAATPAH